MLILKGQKGLPLQPWCLDVMPLGSVAFNSGLFHLVLTQLHLSTATHNSFPLKCPPVLLWDCSRGAGWKPFKRRPLPAEVLLAWKRLSLWMETSLTRLVRGLPLSPGPRGHCQTFQRQTFRLYSQYLFYYNFCPTFCGTMWLLLQSLTLVSVLYKQRTILFSVIQYALYSSYKCAWAHALPLKSCPNEHQ